MPNNPSVAEPVADTPPKTPRSKRIYLYIIIAGVAGLSVMLTLVIIALPTASATHAAHAHIVENPENIARELAKLIAADDANRQVAGAHVSEHITQGHAVPRCSRAPDQPRDADPLTILCALTISTNLLEQSVTIETTVAVTVDPDRDSFKRNPTVISARPLFARTRVNGVPAQEQQSQSPRTIVPTP